MAGPQQPIIVVKKRGHGGHGHHGGAWKVAYADFVTALMAFFLVMWIVGQNQATRKAVASYFRDPGAFAQQVGTGVLPGSESGVTGGGKPDVKTATATLEQAAEHLRQALASRPEFDRLKDQIEITVTEEGLRIELREAPEDGFFEIGSAVVKPQTIELLRVISGELAKLPNKIAVEGHTDQRPYGPGGTYTNWELSADRANAARRVMESAGIQHGQLDAVRGFADTHLRTPAQPLDPGNRRISIVVRRTS